MGDTNLLAKKGKLVESAGGSQTVTNTGSDTTITHLSVNVQAKGKPITLMLESTSTDVTSFAEDGYVAVSSSAGAQVARGRVSLYCDGVIVKTQSMHHQGNPSGFSGVCSMKLPPSVFVFKHTPSAGSHTYSIKAATPNSAGSITFNNIKLVAEL